MNFQLKSFVPHIIALVAFLATAVLYFSPQLSGKVLNQPDLIQYNKMIREINEYKSEERILWSNSMFGGMPTYQTSTIREGNYSKYLDTVLRIGIDRPIGTFIMGSICFYIMMLCFGVNPFVSIVAALCFSFSANNIILLEAGHTSKISVIFYLPLLIGGLHLLYRKFLWLGGLLFTIGMTMVLFANHVQMVYFLFLTLPVLLVVYLIPLIKQKDFGYIGKVFGVIIIGAGIALATASSNILPSKEYKEYTMRGEKLLKKEGNTKGLNFDYAMQWSNDWRDLLASFIPHAVGGSSGEELGADSFLGKEFQQKKSFKLPMYFGNLPFTSGPTYLGIIIMFLFTISLMTLKNTPVKYWFAGGLLMLMLFSLGNNFFLSKPFFDNVPYFNVFRSPNSIMSLGYIFAVGLAALGVHQIWIGELYKEPGFKLKLLISAGIFLVPLAIFALMGGSIWDFSNPADAQYGEQLPAELLEKQRAILLSNDAWIAVLFVLLTVGILWAISVEKLKSSLGLTIIGVLSLIDLARVNAIYLHDQLFISKREYKSIFEPRPVDVAIMNVEKSKGDYRVLDLSINTFNSADASLFHNTVGGYHAAKLQRYQDIIEELIDPEINKMKILFSQKNLTMEKVDSSLRLNTILPMLNAKYLIANPQGQPIQLPANGTSWFANEVKFANDAASEINLMKGLSSSLGAVMETDYQKTLAAVNLENDNSTIKQVSYHPHRLTYEAKTSHTKLAVFSEIWYPAGWNAYIDGKPTEVLRTNYCLRGLLIPAGSHKIEFKFEPKSYEMGKTIALVGSILLFLFMAFVGFIYFRKKEGVV